MASIVKNSFYNTLGMGIYILGMVCVMPLLINQMGDVQFGLFRLALFSVVGYSAILDMGFSNGVLRILANKIAVNDVVSARRIIALSIYIFSIISLLVIFFDVFLIAYFPAYVRTPEELVFPFRILLLATGVYLIFSFFNSIFINIFVIKARFDCVQATKIFGRLFFMFAALVMMKIWGNPLIMMSISVIVISTVVFIWSYYLTVKVWRDFGADFSVFDFDLFKSIASFGSKWFLITLSGILIYSTTEIFVGRFAGLAAVTFYSVPILIGNQITTVITSVSYPIFSVAAHLGVQNQTDEILRLYRLTLRVSAFLFVCVIAPVVVFMKPLLTIWVNPQFAGISTMANIIVLGYFYAVIEYSTQAVLKATGRVGQIALYYIISSLVILAVIFAVLKYTEWGLMGVAWVLSSVSILRSFFVLRNALKQYSADWLTMLCGTLLKTVVGMIPAFICCRILYGLINPDGIFTLILGLICGGIVSLTFSFFLTLDKEQREYVKNYLLSIVGKFLKKRGTE